MRPPASPAVAIARARRRRDLNEAARERPDARDFWPTPWRLRLTSGRTAPFSSALGRSLVLCEWWLTRGGGGGGVVRARHTRRRARTRPTAALTRRGCSQPASFGATSRLRLARGATPRTRRPPPGGVAADDAAPRGVRDPAGVREALQVRREEPQEHRGPGGPAALLPPAQKGPRVPDPRVPPGSPALPRSRARGISPNLARVVESSGPTRPCALFVRWVRSTRPPPPPNRDPPAALANDGDEEISALPNGFGR